MIKYFTSRMNYYKDWWKEATNLNEIYDIIMEKEWVWDTDTCGSYAIQIAVDNNGEITYHSITHEWYVNYDLTKDGDYVINNFVIDEGKPFFVPKVKRDWMMV